MEYYDNKPLAQKNAGFISFDTETNKIMINTDDESLIGTHSLLINAYMEVLRIPCDLG